MCGSASNTTVIRVVFDQLYDDLISRRRRQVERGSPPSNSRGPVGENKSASDKCVHKLSRSKRSKRLVSLWKSTRRRRQRSRCADACAICLATVRGRGVSLDSCHHTRFHVECLEKWLSIDSTCPLCRKSVSTINGRKVEPCERRDLSTEITREEVDWLDSLACELCGSGDDEDVLMFCDGCDTTMHTYCVGLTTVPLGLWFCPQCRDTQGPSLG